MPLIIQLTRDEFINTMLKWEQNKFSAGALSIIYDIENELNDENKNLDKTVIYHSYNEYESEKELLEDYKGCDTMLEIKNNTTVWRISDSGGLLINPF